MREDLGWCLAVGQGQPTTAVNQDILSTGAYYLSGEKIDTIQFLVIVDP